MKRAFVIHPILFAIFPILSLFSNNLRRMQAGEIVRSLVVVASFTLLMWLVSLVVMRDERKTGIIISLFLLLFFSYGNLYAIVHGSAVGQTVVGRHESLLLLLLGLFVFFAYGLTKTRSDLRGATMLFNAIAVGLVVIPIVTILADAIRAKDYVLPEAQINAVNTGNPGKYPDIYYIILDGHARADVLEEIYSYDDSEFLRYLAEKGFYIADKSKANYGQTALSLASSLNSVYLDDVVNQMGATSNDRRPLRDMIKNNAVWKFLQQYGYVFVAFSSGYSPTEIENADVYVEPRWTLSQFENVLINGTPLPLLLNTLPAKSQYDLHRERILYTFHRLANMRDMNSPVFVFAHIMIPHPPLVFGEFGEPVEPDLDLYQRYFFPLHTAIQDYTRQLAFTNKKVIETIDNIVSSSSEPPIIILQADHGPAHKLDWDSPDKSDLKERMSILNAYYLPGGGLEHLYHKITPVNTFRIILNHYFGTDCELLEDRSYFSTWDYPYDLTDVTETLGTD